MFKMFIILFYDVHISDNMVESNAPEKKFVMEEYLEVKLECREDFVPTSTGKEFLISVYNFNKPKTQSCNGNIFKSQ